jgi:hypothetical protein
MGILQSNTQPSLPAAAGTASTAAGAGAGPAAAAEGTAPASPPPPPPSCSGNKLNLKAQTLKLGFHLIGARVETAWVPGAFQLWVRGGQRAPPHRAPAPADRRLRQPKRKRRPLGSGTSGHSKATNFVKPVSHLIGSRVESPNQALSIHGSIGRLHSICTALLPLGHVRAHRPVVVVQVDPFESKL